MNVGSGTLSRRSPMFHAAPSLQARFLLQTMDDGYSGGGGGGFGKGGSQRLMRVMSKGMALADRLHDNDEEEEEGEKDDLMDPLAYFSSRVRTKRGVGAAG